MKKGKQGGKPHHTIEDSTMKVFSKNKVKILKTIRDCKIVKKIPQVAFNYDAVCFILKYDVKKKSNSSQNKRVQSLTTKQ